MKEQYEISDIINTFRLPFLKKYHVEDYQLKVLNALGVCRKAALGGHAWICPDCQEIKISYNSCRNRHCPKCQGFEREKWVVARKEDMLPVKYFHVVFTLPGELHPFCLTNRMPAYTILFRAAWQTLQYFADKQKLQPAMIAILHTWNTQLGYHPHLHCIIPAGGIHANGKWKDFPNANNDVPFLFPVKAMSKVFRAKFTALVDKQKLNIPSRTRRLFYKKQWVVYSKQPFCHIHKTLEYLGRYSHRVAITNRRIKLVTDKDVTFEYTDRKAAGIHKTITMPGEDFLQLFSRHLLPQGFVKIRHYGFLAAANKKKLQLLQKEFNITTSPRKREKIKWRQVCQQVTGNSYLLCPCCQKAEMILFRTILPRHQRGPPNTCAPNINFTY